MNEFCIVFTAENTGGHRDPPLRLIQQDNTEGIAPELERFGIPKEHIVLGFRSPDIRQYTGYAVE
ncbi:XisI protein [Candidatus Poribacteria bacterium]|nr:XisI protein [Candidatus Poribacteria bacterium]